MFNAVYLSPHFDDVVFSCGGQVYRRTQRGESVAVVTVCAAPPPSGDLSPLAISLHERWSEHGTFDRAAEDRAALAILRAAPIHLTVHDCIYRRDPEGGWLYQTRGAILGSLSPLENALVSEVAAAFERVGPLAPDAEIFAPCAIGGHADHQLVRRAAEVWSGSSARRLNYYADYPYAAELSDPGGIDVELTAAARRAKIEAVRAYKSQLSTFWENDDEMARAVSRWPERVFSKLAKSR